MRVSPDLDISNVVIVCSGVQRHAALPFICSLQTSTQTLCSKRVHFTVRQRWFAVPIWSVTAKKVVEYFFQDVALNLISAGATTGRGLGLRLTTARTAVGTGGAPAGAPMFAPSGALALRRIAGCTWQTCPSTASGRTSKTCSATKVSCLKSVGVSRMHLKMSVTFRHDTR